MTYKHTTEIQAQPELLLFEFWEESTSTKERAVLNNENIIHNGETYYAASIDFTPPKAGENAGNASISISNVDRVIGKLINQAKRLIRVRMFVVSRDDFDEIEIDTGDLYMLTDIQVNEKTVSASITLRPDTLLESPPIKASQAFTPGLYLL